jgi:hypothetical protein
MYRPFLVTLLLAGCAVDNTITSKDKEPEFEEGDTAEPPDTDIEDTDIEVPVEECNGVDDDGDGTIDEDFPDANGNGRVDCLDVECPVLDVGTAHHVPILEECAGTTSSEVVDPWDAVIEYQYTSAGSGVIVMPAVGNLNDDNGDGQVDENDVPEIVFTTWSSNTLVALDGATGAELFEVSGYDGQGGVTIADVDADGDPEIIAIQSGYRIAAVDATGTAEWVSASFGMMAYPQPTVADLDNDGMPEVIGDVGVVNGENGTTVATLTGITNSWRTPIAADLDQDGSQEIILGNKVYNSSGVALWSNAGAGAGNFGAVADVDGDPEGEVFFVSGGMAYLHDDDGTLITSFTVPGGSIPGPPCMADFDGDGEVELAVPNSTQISVFDTDGTRLWSATMQDNSGLAGCSGYDVNGDGAYEVLFADEIAFRIYDGASGTILYENRNHASGTVWEYPVIADVDNDGSAEIVVADNGGTWKGVTVFGHSGDGWPKSGTTWATHDFAVTNIEPDGHVPSPPEPSWQVHNVFRARPSVDDPSTSDLLVHITDVCVADCDYGPVSLGFQVTNQGGNDVPAGTLVSIYADDGSPRFLTSVVLPEVPMGTSIDGIEVELSPADIGLYGFIVRVDDDGTGVETERECDETNNEDGYSDVFCF